MSYASKYIPIIVSSGRHRHMRMTTGTLWILCLLMLIGISSCGRDTRVVYADFIDMPSGGWPRDEFCEFNTAATDSSLFADKEARYDVMLTVRHTDDYPYTAIAMSAVESIDNSTCLPDTVRVTLMSRDGKWFGRSSKGIYTLTDTILRNATLPSLYSLRLFHTMPSNPLPGLLSLGLIIEKR